MAGLLFPIILVRISELKRFQFLSFSTSIFLTFVLVRLTLSRQGSFCNMEISVINGSSERSRNLKFFIFSRKLKSDTLGFPVKINTSGFNCFRGSKLEFCLSPGFLCFYPPKLKCQSIAGHPSPQLVTNWGNFAKN